MARALWSGAIGFGLVNVPVRLFQAVRPKNVNFHQLHDADGGRIKMKRVCSIDGKEVEYDHVVKGYEIARGQYVRVDPKELEALDPQGTHSVDIEQFVDLEEIDPLFWDTSYRVLPDKGGARPLRLLVDAMEKGGKVAIGRFVMRTKSHLCALRVVDGELLLTTMHYADELVAAEDIEAKIEKGRAPTAKEVQLAVDLIASLEGKFDPTKFRDDYRERVEELVQKKAEGEEIVAPPEGEPARVINLMDALRQSLAAKEKPAARGERRAAREHAPAARAKRAPAKKRAKAKSR